MCRVAELALGAAVIEPLDRAISRAYLDGLAEALSAMADTERDVGLGAEAPKSRFETAWVELRGKLERRHDMPPPEVVITRARASYASMVEWVKACVSALREAP